MRSQTQDNIDCIERLAWRGFAHFAFARCFRRPFLVILSELSELDEELVEEVFGWRRRTITGEPSMVPLSKCMTYAQLPKVASPM